MTLQEAANIADFIIKYIGLGAFALACLSLYLQRRDKRPKLRLIDPKLSLQEVVPAADLGGATTYKTGPALNIRVQNPGEKDIRLASARLRSRHYLFWYRTTELPHADVYRALGSVAAGTGRVLTLRIPESVPLQGGHGYLEFEDEVGARYRSKLFRLRIM